MSKDLIGQTFGRWTVIDEGPGYLRPGATGKPTQNWVVECSCGTRNLIVTYTLVSGSSRSCGCLTKDVTAERNYKHGLSKHPLFGVLQNIKKRCCNPSNEAYERYGGRGITVCQEWQNSFEAFILWGLDNGWRKGLEIDRVDNDGPYSPENCRFVTPTLNGRNKRNNVLFQIEGKSLTAGEILETYPNCVKLDTFMYRMKKGWDIHDALTMPPQRGISYFG